MSTIKSENWDGVTAPAMPTGWNSAAGFLTWTGSFNSSPNSVANGTDTAGNPAYWNTSDDGNGGNAQASCVFKADFATTTCRARIYCRMTTASTSVGSLTAYYVLLDFVGSSSIAIYKVVSGTATSLQSRSPGALGTTEKYRAYCVTVGSTITARVQRLSDSTWLDSGNVWQVAQQDYLSVSSGTITGAGKAGVGFEQFNSSDLVWGDDFLFETVTPPTRRQTQASFI